MRLRSSISCLLAFAALAICAAGVPTGTGETVAGTSTPSEVRSNFSPGNLFDFKNYKAVFRKTYTGMLEEMVRAKYFLSRAFRAFISAIKYKYRKSTFYLAVNSRSDWTPEEFERSRNKVLEEQDEAGIDKARRTAGSEPARAEADDLPNLLPANEEETAGELKRMAESVISKTAEARDGKLRDLPLEKLMSTRADTHPAAEAVKEISDKIPSNNPNYQAPELPSYGLRDERKFATRWLLTKDGDRTHDFIFAFAGQMNALESGKVQLEPKSDLPDEVFVDLRDTGCFNDVRAQGVCGSCWAFAGTTMFEYLYCMQKGVLPKFSEQYMVDCSGYIAGANGCSGGNALGAAQFVQNFGVEMRTSYPYNGRQNECPHEESTNLNQTGYIRFDFEDVLRLEVEIWPKHLTKMPIYAAITIGSPFYEYGGGVLSTVCTKKSSHAIVIIGHGREDGLEYWLIRNSEGTDWGERGYAKIAKNSGCIDTDRGYMFGTGDGKSFDVNLTTNNLHDDAVIKKHLENRPFRPYFSQFMVV